jgi:hypothetical protein
MRAIVASLMLFAAMPAAATNLLINGSFEEGPFLRTDPLILAAGSTALPGWDLPTDFPFSQGGIELTASAWNASDGVRSIDLAGTGPGVIQQGFATTIGQTYRLSFDIARNQSGIPIQTISVFLGERSSNTGINFSRNALGFNTPVIWTTWTRDFVATSVESRVVFFGMNAKDAVLLDNVKVHQVAAVPEPASWALLLTGFGLAGSMLRRKQRLPA